jgi:hypothetical protein
MNFQQVQEKNLQKKTFQQLTFNIGSINFEGQIVWKLQYTFLEFGDGFSASTGKQNETRTFLGPTSKILAHLKFNPKTHVFCKFCKSCEIRVFLCEI